MTQYASAAEFDEYGLPAAASSSLSTTEKNEHLTAASGLFDSYVEDRGILPLTTVPTVLKMHVCKVAAYTLMRRRGVSPERDLSDLERDHDRAVFWFRDVGKGIANLPRAETAPDRTHTRVASATSSATKRGF